MITVRQIKRLWAIAYESAHNLDLGPEDASDRVKGLLREFGVSDADDLESDAYDRVIDRLVTWGEGGDSD